LNFCARAGVIGTTVAARQQARNELNQGGTYKPHNKYVCV
jgi:hypothetical protein